MFVKRLIKGCTVNPELSDDKQPLTNDDIDAD